ncbi:hypothetical protein J3A83DRAFT_3252078 [Scleroderma citrinum]
MAALPRRPEDLAVSSDTRQSAPLRHHTPRQTPPSGQRRRRAEHSPRQALPSQKYSPPPKHDDDGPSFDQPDNAPSWDDSPEDEAPKDTSSDDPFSGQTQRKRNVKQQVATRQRRRAEHSPHRAFPSQKYSPPPKHDDRPSFDQPDDAPSQDDSPGDDEAPEDTSSDDPFASQTQRKRSVRQQVATGQSRRAEHSPRQAFPSQKYSPPPKHDDDGPSFDQHDDAPSQDDWPGEDELPEDTPSDDPSAGQAQRKRSVKQQVSMGLGAGFCPVGLSACPIQSAFGSFPDTGNDEFECVDFLTDLDHCGGCSSLDPGRHNCRAVPHVSSVACVHGQCVITACQPGYTLQADAHTCTPA